MNRAFVLQYGALYVFEIPFRVNYTASTDCRCNPIRHFVSLSSFIRGPRHSNHPNRDGDVRYGHLLYSRTDTLVCWTAYKKLERCVNWIFGYSFTLFLASVDRVSLGIEPAQQRIADEALGSSF